VNRVSRRLLASPVRLFVAAVICSFAVVGIVVASVSPAGAVAVAQKIMSFLRGAGAAGPPLFAALQVVVALSGVLPASLLAVAAGAIFGLGEGFALTAIATLLGALIAFWLSRSLFRPAIARLVAQHTSLSGLDASVSRHGWKVVCLMRASPVMPFSATSFLFGLTSVTLLAYLAGTLASLPALFGYVLLGTMTAAGVGAWAVGSSPLRWLIWGVGGTATLFLLIGVGRLVLQRQVACN
jgi:uncharacterized membrane protein YdjX (TVP38/TMEM64 family)